MNPFQNIVNSLQQVARQYASPQKMMQMTKQPSQPVTKEQSMIKPLAQLGGVPAENFGQLGQQVVQRFGQSLLTPQAQAILKGTNPVQQSQQIQQENPFVKFLAARGVRVPTPQPSFFSQVPQQPGQQPNIMNAGFNAQNITIPVPNQIKNNLAIESQKQEKGDLIR